MTAVTCQVEAVLVVLLEAAVVGFSISSTTNKLEVASG